MVRSGSDRTRPDVGKRSFAFDLVSDSLSLLGGVRKVKFRLLQRAIARGLFCEIGGCPYSSDYGEIWVVADLFGLPEVAAVVSDYVRQEGAQGHFEPPKRSLGSGQVEAVGFLNELG